MAPTLEVQKESEVKAGIYRPPKFTPQLSKEDKKVEKEKKDIESKYIHQIILFLIINI